MSGDREDNGRRGVAAGLGTEGGAPRVLPDMDVVPKMRTGIPGLDGITLGGLTVGRTTLVCGPAGSGKTVFGAQFLCEGVKRGEPGVFVTFEEPAADLRQNIASLGWNVEGWEASEEWRFVDASPILGELSPADYNFETLLARIGEAVDLTAARRIVLDSLNVAYTQVDDPAITRQNIRHLALELRRLRLTTLMTLEQDPDSPTPESSFGFQQHVADNVILLRNLRDGEKRRRTIEVLKMRGGMHRRGEYPFTVLPGQGLVVVPLSVIELSQHSTDVRITSGNPGLDDLCHGGFFRDSVVLASGGTGTGKTLLVTEFLAGGAENGERSLLFAFEESREQIFRNARGWGRDFERLERKGLLRVVATYPEVGSLEDHLIEITREIESFKPARIAIDSLSALQRSGSPKGFREFLIVLTSYVKAEQLATLFTASTATIMGGPSATDDHVSTLTDSIILLRYVELDGEVRRGLTVLKMRGSSHDRRIHEFTIDDAGLHIERPFRGVAGILTGHVVALPDDGDDGEGAGGADS